MQATWGGPVTLAGDALHPVIPSFGQGANLAMEDAQTLAVELRTWRQEGGEGSPADAFRRWEAQRLPRTREAQIGSFISGTRSYGKEKAAKSLQELDPTILAAHQERFHDQSALTDFLHEWEPSV
ncbi:hypothetical protein CYMTET_55744 [Cymbomonas tetramitiformis]|uniref:FAD-binding domain-containing protein n=1 Tax=Cymbomonas tetramitiformis TaxID=36881 RepID=A0AAE0BCA9_9CHLO|nr:hypothetical protein CYMTET_55744 [Cymbomonas tetramitiformis]